MSYLNRRAQHFLRNYSDSLIIKWQYYNRFTVTVTTVIPVVLPGLQQADVARDYYCRVQFFARVANTCDATRLKLLIF